jgi:hypothetical protein
MPHQIGAERPDDIDEEELPRIERVRDVLVVPSPGHRANAQEWLDNLPADGPVDLGNGVFVERLRGDDSELAEQVIQAAIPRRLNFDAYRSFGQLYSFWRLIPEDEWNGQGMFHWDPTHAITR